MEDLIVEIGIKLDKDLIFYHNMLVTNGLELLFSCVTHDIYYSKNNLDNLTENEIKKSCIRIRKVIKLNEKFVSNKEDKIKSEKLLSDGYKVVFDTMKFDFQYGNDNIKSMVQLQNIKDIGILVYYDNPDYYNLPVNEQRIKLIDELNSFGFSIEHDTLGLDKLRTLYHNKEMFSANQNA